MAGGLLNIISVGSNNVILTENRARHFLKLPIPSIQILDYKNSDLIMTGYVIYD